MTVSAIPLSIAWHRAIVPTSTVWGSIADWVTGIAEFGALVFAGLAVRESVRDRRRDRGAAQRQAVFGMRVSWERGGSFGRDVSCVVENLSQSPVQNLRAFWANRADNSTVTCLAEAFWTSPAMAPGDRYSNPDAHLPDVSTDNPAFVVIEFEDAWSTNWRIVVGEDGSRWTHQLAGSR